MTNDFPLLMSLIPACPASAPCVALLPISLSASRREQAYIVPAIAKSRIGTQTTTVIHRLEARVYGALPGTVKNIPALDGQLEERLTYAFGSRG